MIEVVQAFDRVPITQIEADGAAALERVIGAARRLFADRSARLKAEINRAQAVSGSRSSGA